MAAPPTAADVGDAASFGKHVLWIGLATTGTVFLTGNCAALPLGPNDRCAVVSPGSTTPFFFRDLGSITLPAASAGTFICHWATPNVIYTFDNTSGASPIGQFNARATYRIESEVLADPALINPQTGAPFGGRIDASINGVEESKGLAVGELATHNVTATRTCIAGLVSKSALMDAYGLSEATANKFFQKPITIRVGASGSATGVTNARVGFGTRFTTDER